MNFTKEQTEAIAYRGEHSAAVSASAGSGKTAVLVEHIAALISDRANPVYADRLAAVTFTEKAAAELRQRLEKRMKELLRDNPGDDFFREQLVRLSYARISTISSFCLSLIRDNIRLLPLEEGFAVCGDIERKALSDKAMKMLFRHIYKETELRHQEEISVRLGGEKNISEAVLKLHDFLSNIPSGSEWMKEQAEVYGDPERYAELYSEPLRNDMLKALDQVSALKNKVSEIFDDLIDEKDIKAGEKHKTYFNNLFEEADFLRSSLAHNNYDRLLHRRVDFGRAPAVKKDSPFVPLSEIRDGIKAILKDCARKSALLINREKDREECGRHLELLRGLEQVYDREYSALKRKAGVVDFSDLEHFALEAVKAGGSKGVYDYIIVDEFQDSNDIQYEIFRCLSDGEKNLYLVGDAKQCIYSFRSANPEIFASLPSNKNYKSICLNSNFRSSSDVIDTVNKVFGGCCEDELPESFSGSPWQDMTAGRGIDHCDKNRSELIIINSLKDRDDCRSREARYTAKRIQDMIKSGFTVHDKNGERPCGYGDFAILTRTNTIGAVYRRVFEDLNIPCVSTGDKAFTSLIEIELALALLSAVLRPNDDRAVVTSIMSPVYGFTAEETARVRLAEGTDIKNPHKLSLYGILSAVAESENDGVLSSKAKKFISDMQLFRKSAANSLTHELLSEIYSVTMLPDIMSVGRKGRERRENLRLLLYYARGNPRPSDFLAVMRHVNRSKLEMPQAQVKEQEERSVKIMTIHSSKGLQFPVVFIGGSDVSPNKRDSFQAFIFDKEKGAGISVCDFKRSVKCATASHQLLADSYNDKVAGEELRLLYVAMTRAEEKLIITAGCNVTEKNANEADSGEKEYFGGTGSYLSFLRSRFDRNPSAFEFTLIPSHDDKSAEPEAIDASSGTSDDKAVLDADKIRKRINYKYPYEKAVHTPAKFTATSLGINADSPDEPTGEANISSAFYMGLPVFMKKNRPLTPKERGDIYHKVMEYVDFTADSADLELKRLAESRIISDDEKNAVNPQEIQRFLNSTVAKRAGKAKKVFREFPIFTTISLTGDTCPDNDDLSFIQGIADMFFEENDEIVLVDYKTNRNTTPEKLKEEYTGQLGIYRKALEEMTGMRVKECILFSFSLGKEITVQTDTRSDE